MVQTSARLLRLLSLLQRRRFWAGPELAEALEVTERSVRRDVDRLRSLGYPVHATSGVGGGYQLGAGPELPPLPLEDDEAVAVAVGLRSVTHGPVRGLGEASLRALTKLEQVLPRRLQRRVQALDAVAIPLQRAGAGGIDAEVLSHLATACRDAEELSFSYRAGDGSRTSRTVEPYRLIHTAWRWYLLAYDLGRSDWRTFRVDRVEGRPLSGRTFAPRPLPSDDVAAYVSAAISPHGTGIQTEVVFHAPAGRITKRLGDVVERVVEEGPDRCRIQVRAPSAGYLALSLAFAEADFEVGDPPELASELQLMAERLMRAASSGGEKRSRRRGASGP